MSMEKEVLIILSLFSLCKILESGTQTRTDTSIMHTYEIAYSSIDTHDKYHKYPCSTIIRRWLATHHRAVR